MKIEKKDFACVTNVEILPSNIEIKQDVDEQNFDILNSVEIAEEATVKVPYILNGELYKILSRKGENVTVKCCYCPEGRFYRGSVRSTGNFHMHIKRRHPYLLGRLHEMKVASLLERRDRLTKNRKNKRLRRVPFKLTPKVEVAEDMHKLKIKRAFQRHQAEANNSHQATFATETGNGAQSFGAFKMKQEQMPQFIETLPMSTDILVDGNIYYDVRMRSNAEAITPGFKLSASRQSTPTPTPYPSPYEGSAFGVYNTPPPAAHHIDIEAADERPLDLSLNGAQSIDGRASTADLNMYESSGIGVGPMCSDTTVANTVSTYKSVGDNHVTAAMFHNFGDPNWQRVSLVLHDIHNDLTARNRIEHNRLLLDLAKFKFMHPSFYFNLQE